MAPPLDIPYEQARAARGALFHEGRSIAQADLYELDWEGRRALLKDFGGRPWLVWRTWGRAVIGREVRVMKALAGLEGVPQLLATAGPEAYIMERLEGKRLPKIKGERLPADYWDRARRQMDAMHALGIAHGDLRRKNMMFGPGGEAYLIDFASAVRARGDGRGIGQFFFNRLKNVDRITFARLKRYYLPDGLSAEETGWLENRPWYYSAGKRLKAIYKLRKPSTWRRIWKRMRGKSKPRGTGGG